VHRSAERVAAVLAAAGARGRVRELPVAARTAALAAEALGCPVGAVANSLVFAVQATSDAEPTPVLVLTSGAHQADLRRLATLLDAVSVELANPALVRTATGYAVGGVPPIGHRTALPTLVDNALATYDEIWAAAGVPEAVFPTTYDELLAITGGTPADVAGQPAPGQTDQDRP
jgi:prolyl-tRNA editing enzyme YbaK/EbsC (Cys-tRNA(Pro) deacylase)